MAEATLYADDMAVEVVKEFQSGTITLGIDDIGTTAASELTGAVIDENNVLVSSSEDITKPVAIGFRAKRSSGKYSYFWIYRVKFGVPSTSLETKGDIINFQTPSIEGTILPRNKANSAGKHPWKAEATEGDTGVDPETITGWFNSVYEE